MKLKLLPSFRVAVLYGSLVSLSYILVGGLGVDGKFPPLPGLIAWFLMVDPYVLGHFGKSYIPPHPCLVYDLPDGFGAHAIPGNEFASISLIVLLLGVVGLAAVIVNGRLGRMVLFALLSLATITTIINWLAYAIIASQPGMGGESLYWVPLMSTFWLATYWMTMAAFNIHGKIKPGNS